MEGIGRLSGRLSAIVKGSRRRGSSYSGLCEPPVLLRVRLNQGSSLAILTQPVLLNAFLSIRHNLSRLLVAAFLGRLFLASLPERFADMDVFELLLHLYQALGEEVSPPLCGLWGQERLLCVLGLSPELDSCVLCGSKEVSGFSSLDGGVMCAACYRGKGFALTESSRDLCYKLRTEALGEIDLSLSQADRKALGRLYKEHFQTHLGVPPHYFKRVIP